MINLKPWEVVEFDWGCAIRHRKGSWQTIIFSDNQELDVSNMDVILHDNGIEFYEEMKK